MGDSKNMGLNTICAHVGEVKDEQFKGAISPLYMSSSYAYENVDVKRYPRYFNTPNQEALGKKIAALEHTESGMIFGSGMAAVSHCLLAFLQKGDHIVLQKTLYGVLIILWWKSSISSELNIRLPMVFQKLISEENFSQTPK